MGGVGGKWLDVLVNGWRLVGLDKKWGAVAVVVCVCEGAVPCYYQRGRCSSRGSVCVCMCVCRCSTMLPAGAM